MVATSGAARIRPRAALRGTLSLVTAASIVLTRSSAAVIDRRSPPNAKQSSLSCAISRGLQSAMIENERGDRRRVVEPEDGDAETGQRRVTRDRHDRRIVGAEQRLADRPAMHLELLMPFAVDALVAEVSIGARVGDRPRQR